VTAPAEITPKRSYRRPALAVYGSIVELTLTSATMNKNDTMSGSITMT
jgi:hypothetical protein